MQERLTLVFDGGDTLMRVFDYPGPMVDWPELQAMDGVVEALEALLPSARMVVATNALDSTPEQIWEAMHRVGLGEYVSSIFTPATTGALKPEPAFFQQIEVVLDRSARQIVMIGDSYTNDVLGAKAAGWRAVWYNPTGSPAPGSHPFHDREIQHMADLPAALYAPDLPDVPTCLAWLQRYGASHGVLQHVQTVAAVSYLLACWLRQGGQQIDPILAHRGALLHDIAKLPALRQGPGSDHARMAREILAQEFHQPQIAEIADRHMITASADDPRYPRTWEEKIVHYADKLAEGAQLVALEERLASLQQRYPGSAREIAAGTPALQALQAEICAGIGCAPEELMRRLAEALRG